MNIAIIGYGKMGKVIETIALSRGHEVTIKVGREGVHSHDFYGVDVAIEFSKPEMAFDNVLFCLEHDIPVACGTTAWLQHYDDAVRVCNMTNGAFLYASNFSLGVNLFFEINKKVAALMSAYPQYKVSMEEIHHTAKLDAPSGSAVTLANDIQAFYPNITSIVNEATDSTESLGIVSKRIDPAPGTHSIFYDSSIDSIEIKHTAHSREGFALGAVVAAEWLAGKQGVFGMRDVLLG